MIYVPYRVDENIFKQQYSMWEHAYNSLIEIIKCNEQKFTYKTNVTLGELEHATNEIENKEKQLFNINFTNK
jgi:hypothetical protein